MFESGRECICIYTSATVFACFFFDGSNKSIIFTLEIRCGKIVVSIGKFNDYGKVFHRA